MSAPLAVRGESPFPEVGEGIFLFFRNSELAVLEQEMGQKWFTTMVEEFIKGEVRLDFVLRLAHMGAKKRNEQGVRINVDVASELFDEIPIVTTMERIFDAICFSMHGKSAKDYVEEMFLEIERQVQARQDGEELPSLFRPDTDTSMIPEENASGQE